MLYGGPSHFGVLRSALKHFRLSCREFTPFCHSDRSPTDAGGRTEWRNRRMSAPPMLLQGVLTELLKAHACACKVMRGAKEPVWHIGNLYIFRNCSIGS